MTTPFGGASRGRPCSLAVVFFLALAFAAAAGDAPSFAPDAEALGRHAAYLASPPLGGRAVGTAGIERARDYIGAEFAAYGLRPGGDGGTYFQHFTVTTGIAVKEPSVLAFDGEEPLAIAETWSPLGLSASGTVNAEIVFAGYGITATEYGYDDYAGIDARGKIVLVFRYEPSPVNAKSPFRSAFPYSPHAALRTKASNARDHGAAGMILVDFNHTADGDKELLPTSSTLWRSNADLIAIQIKRRVLEEHLGRRGVSIESLKRKIDEAGKPASVNLGFKASLTVTLEEARQAAQNVVAILPGSDAAAGAENIVIGAHYDHLGPGHYGTPDPRTVGQIHPGADDNASGTAVLLEVARGLSSSLSRPARSIVFVAFSAEELGLHGSRRYVDDPPLPLSATRAMLNLDMVGRLRDNRLTAFGTRSAQELSGIMNDEGERLGLSINESDGIGRSDHMSFYNKGIPSLHLFTGTHSDYHRPGDTSEKLNAPGMGTIAALVSAAAHRLASTDLPLVFTKLPGRPVADHPTARSYGPYLGTIPDFSGAGRGVRLAAITEGSPAEAAGLRDGDVIVEFAGGRVDTLEDLTALLRAKQPGDSVEIVVLRRGQPLSVRATLRSRS